MTSSLFISSLLKYKHKYKYKYEHKHKQANKRNNLKQTGGQDRKPHKLENTKYKSKSKFRDPESDAELYSNPRFQIE